MAATSEAPTTEIVPPVAVEARPGTDVPRLARGVELIGRFEDSGFKEPPYLARRRDGQVVQLAPLLYALAEEVDGRRDTAQIAEALSHRIQRQVTADNVEMLLEEQLRRLGLVVLREGFTGEVAKVDPLLALKFRTKVVPERVVHTLTTLFRPLFLAPVMLVVVAAFAALVAWLFGVHGISQGLRHVLYQPALLFMLMGGVVLATAFHEIGHATAVRYGGAKPGVMGVGVYIVWPAFYTDITDAYRLPKWGRLRADVGGMYFNAVFGLCAAAAYVATDFEPLLLLVVLQAFAIVQQSLPFLRLDGYYIVSDLTGVPDMLTRIRPVLAGLLPWRKADERVTELKPWVRVVVTAYVIVIVPVLAALFAVMLAHAPRAFATAWDSLGVRAGRLGDEPTATAVKDVFQMVVLVLPCLGMVYTTTRIAHRAGLGAWRWSGPSAARRVPLLAGAGALLGSVGFLWWPTHGEYRPIRVHDRGTLRDAIADLPRVRAVAPAPAVAAPAAQPRKASAPAAPAKPKPTPKPTRPQHTTTTTTSSTTTVPDQWRSAPVTPTTTPTETTPAPTTPTETVPTQTTTAPAQTTTTPTETTPAETAPPPEQ